MKTLNKTKKKRFADFYFKDDQSIILLIPTSEKAKLWVNSNINLPEYQNSNMPVIERRFFQAIYTAIVMEGLTIKGF